MELCGFSFQPKWSREIELLQVRILTLAYGSGITRANGSSSLYQPQIRFPSDIAVWFVNMLTPTQSGFRQSRFLRKCLKFMVAGLSYFGAFRALRFFRRIRLLLPIK